jgi:beta-glucosidase/6-phospho-beta-glucosidase/beta-galactosidase
MTAASPEASLTSSAALMHIAIGIEGTFAPHCAGDTLSVTGHFAPGQAARDLDLVRDLGLSEVRYPIPWHAIERRRGSYDWQLMDSVLQHAAPNGLTIIADTLHHTSFPAWLDGGFLNPALCDAYPAFVDAFAARYPSVSIYTPFNEPTCTLDFCGARGWWYPYGRDDDHYVQMLRVTARATALAITRLRARNSAALVLHVDTFERHAALDQASAARAAFLNQRRFLFEELLTGRVDGQHPLYGYLRRHGFPAADLRWHRRHPARIDERGGNYYPLSEEQLRDGVTAHAPSTTPVGFAAVVREYAARLDVPLSLTETNIQGTVRDRISWLKYMLEQTEQLAATGVWLRRFAWYPLFDCAGWQVLLRGGACEWPRDPQGIFSCDEQWRRIPTELSHCYAQVARGAPSTDLPAYRFGPQHERSLHGWRSQMLWHWRESE